MGRPIPPDANMLARRILLAAINPHVGRYGDPRQRASNAARYMAIDPFTHLTPERRKELVRLAILARWGSATLGIMPKDSSNVDTNCMAARILAEAVGEQPKTIP